MLLEQAPRQIPARVETSRSLQDYEPSVANPLVYHLHGHEPVVDSLVITEDDYLDFMVNISQRSTLIPAVVLDAMTDNTLLFLGYSLNDWNFRVLFAPCRISPRTAPAADVTVQLRPGSGEDSGAVASEYFQKQSIVVFWAFEVPAEAAQRARRMAEQTAASTEPRFVNPPSGPSRSPSAALAVSWARQRDPRPPSLLIAHRGRIYSPSGAGKTSLLMAACSHACRAGDSPSFPPSASSPGASAVRRHWSTTFTHSTSCSGCRRTWILRRLLRRR
jgi:hypothetical protein